MKERKTKNAILRMFNKYLIESFKSFCAMLILSVFVFSLNGCVQKQDNAAESLNISVWHWMTDRQDAFKELAKRYEEQAGIKVNFELYAPSDAYSQKIRAAAQGDNLPDIFGVLGEKRDFASFIKAGHILNLTTYMQENNAQWQNFFFEKALSPHMRYHL